MRRLACLLLAALAGCEPDGGPAELDGIDDSLDEGGKSDTGAVVEGTDDAYTALMVASFVSEQDLRFRAGLGVHASSTIGLYRLGDPDDEHDFEQFETLRELDALPWIGARAVEHMLAYGKTLGWRKPLRDQRYLVRLDPAALAPLAEGPIAADDVAFQVTVKVRASGQFVWSIADVDGNSGSYAHTSSLGEPLTPAPGDERPGAWDSFLSPWGVRLSLLGDRSPGLPVRHPEILGYGAELTGEPTAPDEACGWVRLHGDLADEFLLVGWALRPWPEGTEPPAFHPACD